MQLHAYRRTEKTPVSLFGLDLEFVPNSAGHVVCEVSDERAIERLLSISDAYQPYTGEGVRAPAPVAPVVSVETLQAASVPPGGNDDDGEGDKVFDAELLGSDALPATFDVAGLTYTQAQMVELAFTRSGMDREEWNLNDEDDREALIQGAATQLILAAEAAALAAAEKLAAEQELPGEPLVIVSETGEKVDLGAMSATKLREFAAANGINLPKGNSVKVGDLRLMVAKAITGA